MAISDLELFGRKTFFIAATEDLIPQDYLAGFIEQGFETYLIDANDAETLKHKVSAIIKMFPDSILFFNISKDIIDWKQYLGTLQASAENDFLLGVLFEFKDELSAEHIRSDFGKICTNAHFLALKNDDAENFFAIQTVLSALKARGRRNSVRAECDENSNVDFLHKGAHYHATLLDINETNFSCHVEDIEPNFPMFEQIHGITLFVDGLTLKVSATLIMKRLTKQQKKCIFMFIKDDGTPDLDEKNAEKLSKKICEIVLNKNMARINAAIF